MKKIKVEFFHDVICSFCFPMSYRMRKLKELMPELEIIHRSFGLVKKENDFIEMFGSRENAKEEIMSHWHHANKNDDLHRFNIEGMKNETFLFPMSIKPLKACKAAKYIGGEDAYWDLFDALQTEFFVNNRNIELDEIIFENVKKIGLDFEKWKTNFNSNEVERDVELDFELVEKYGLKSVPALVINEKYIINGATSVDYVKKVIEGLN